jgi:hypothetical protein
VKGRPNKEGVEHKLSEKRERERAHARAFGGRGVPLGAQLEG